MSKMKKMVFIIVTVIVLAVATTTTAVASRIHSDEAFLSSSQLGSALSRETDENGVAITKEAFRNVTLVTREYPDGTVTTTAEFDDICSIGTVKMPWAYGTAPTIDIEELEDATIATITYHDGDTSVMMASPAGAETAMCAVEIKGGGDIATSECTSSWSRDESLYHYGVSYIDPNTDETVLEAQASGTSHDEVIALLNKAEELYGFSSFGVKDL